MLNENKRLGLRLVANDHFGLSFPEWKAIPGLGETTLGNDTAFDATLHTDQYQRPDGATRRMARIYTGW